MVNLITTAVALTAASITSVAALPKHLHAQPESRATGNFGPHLPHKTYTTMFGEGNDLMWSAGGESTSPETVATLFASHLAPHSEFIVQSSHTSQLSGVTHVYLRQVVDGIEVVNGDMNISVDRHGQVLSAGNSFAQPVQSKKESSSSWWKQLVFSDHDAIGYRYTQAAEPVIPPESAILALLSHVGHTVHHTPFALRPKEEDSAFMLFDLPGAQSDVRVRRAYSQLETGELVQVWDIEIELVDHWYNAHVNAHDGRLVGLVDWVSDAVYYNVIPFGANDPSEAEQTLLRNPHDLVASPIGWQTQDGGYLYNVTIGNNVYAHTNPDGGYNWEENYRPAAKSDDEGHIIFDYRAKFDVDEPKQYEDAAVTNLFYWCNTAHDLFYRYGFDEKSGNFQESNLGRGRENDDGENDAVIANAQDGSGRNNANFATPPDGRHGKMRMYVWDQTHPMRDGDFESGIIIHEYTHGVSNRLTQGPHNSNCLGWGEAGGMGEGWGDFVATIIRMSINDTRESDFGMGGWANGGPGIRNYKYSTSMETNPSTYRIMDRFNYWGVHAKGEVWAEMLYEVYWDLVDAHGYTPIWFPPADIHQARDHILNHGNTLALQLVMDGMKQQPCNPTFVDARDAILSAESQLTHGENYCLIYAAFARRGLGVGAELIKEGWLERRTESFDVPARCRDA